MKLIFLLSSGTILYLMRFHKVIRVTYDREQDTFRYQFLIFPCAVLACVLNSEFTVMEVSAAGGAGTWVRGAACKRRHGWCSFITDTGGLGCHDACMRPRSC